MQQYGTTFSISSGRSFETIKESLSRLMPENDITTDGEAQKDAVRICEERRGFFASQVHGRRFAHFYCHVAKE